MSKYKTLHIKESIPLLKVYLLEAKKTQPIQALIDFKTSQSDNIRQFAKFSDYNYSTLRNWFRRYRKQGIKVFINGKHLRSTIGQTLINRDGEVIFYQEIFNDKQSEYLLNILQTEIAWRQDYIKMMGRILPLPRLTAWYGDADKSYTYSGINMNPLAWTDTLLYIKERAETLADTQFNSVLLNFYRDGRDSVAWHSDDEPELGNNPVIASVSFGSTRKFSFKHKQEEDIINLDLTSGSLLIMRGATQHHWLHQLPKTNHNISTRINLTFRNII
jgi:alkylated DNA repair dioxygenase AlkB